MPRQSNRGNIRDPLLPTDCANKAIFIQKYKVEKGCLDCGFNGHHAALDFDHVRGTKEFNLGSGFKRDLATVLVEIAKCDVVCSNCHRIRTYLRHRPWERR